MKRKIFFTGVVFFLLLLILMWLKMNTYRTNIKEVHQELERLKEEIYLLNYQASTLKNEMETLHFFAELKKRVDVNSIETNNKDTVPPWVKNVRKKRAASPEN